jgi:D-ribose pyranase
MSALRRSTLPLVAGRPWCEVLLLEKRRRIYNIAPMLNMRILNPHLLSLLARVRHTNALVIADRGFPFWPGIETVDISLQDDIPTVLQVLAAIREDFHAAQAFMAQEFLKENTPATQARYAKALENVPTTYEAHTAFKKRVPGAIGLVRTGDTIQYANLILISG